MWFTRAVLGPLKIILYLMADVVEVVFYLATDFSTQIIGEQFILYSYLRLWA